MKLTGLSVSLKQLNLLQQVIYHPYGGVSNRYDYRTYPAYGGSYGGSYDSYPAPYIKTGLEYSIGNGGYGNSY